MNGAVIINPYSGSSSVKELKEYIRQDLPDYEIFELSDKQTPGQLAKSAINEGYKTIVISGGDGSINDVVRSIAQTDIKLGIIPSGTGNMLAANLGIPLNVRDSLKVIKKGASKKIDIGKVNDKYFTFMGGCGLSSSIIEHSTVDKKKLLGPFTYYLEGIRLAFDPTPSRFKIILDDKKKMSVKALTLIVANKADFIGDIFSLAPQASFVDGEMELIIISIFRKIDYFYALWSIFTRQHCKRFSRIRYYKFKKLEIYSKPELNFQVDGDIIGKTPVSVEVLASALNVIVPGNN